MEPSTASTTADIRHELDPERQRLAQQYAGIRRRLFFLEMGATVALVALFLAAGWSMGLRQWAEAISDNPWIVVALYGVALGAGYTIISLPLDFYASYVLPHRFGLSTQTLSGWVMDSIKSTALAAVLALAGLEMLYWLLRAFPEWWWVLMAGMMWLFAVVMAQLAPVLLMPLFYKFRPLDDPELEQRLTRLAEQAGTIVRGVYIMDLSSRTTAANAMLTGLGRTRRIILGDTLLKGYTHDEIETVLAHELAHHVHNDMPKSLVIEAVLFGLGMWVASMLLGWGVSAFGFRGIADVAALPIFAFAMFVFGLIAMPGANYLSRQMERAADLYALRTTGKSQAFRSVMMKLAGQNLSEANPPAWVRFLFYSHPPISERIQVAEAFARRQS
jgi:STE24 endopeptidase